MKTIGIIAGNGRFPILVAEEAKRQEEQAAEKARQPDVLSISSKLKD